MGEVSRARGTRLGRDVAIKVLAPHVAAEVYRGVRYEDGVKVTLQSGGRTADS